MAKAKSGWVAVQNPQLQTHRKSNYDFLLEHCPEQRDPAKTPVTNYLGEKLYRFSRGFRILLTALENVASAHLSTCWVACWRVRDHKTNFSTAPGQGQHLQMSLKSRNMKYYFSLSCICHLSMLLSCRG